MSETNYFLASSPRHLFLFAGLALEYAAAARNRLYFIEHVPAASVAKHLDMIRRWQASPFASADVLEADYRPLLAAAQSPSKRRLKQLFRQRNRVLLDAAMQSDPADAVWVGTDDYYESQYLLHRSRSARPERRAIYVEDGVSAYEHSYQNTHIRNRPKEWLRALRYFPWWKPSPVPGASGWLHEGYVAYPQFVMPALASIELQPLPRAQFLSVQFRQLAQIMAEGFGVDTVRLAKADVLIAVTHSKWSGLLPGYRPRMQALCRSLLNAGMRVAIKPHPRDPEPNPLGLADHDHIYRVPGQAMFEVLTVIVENPSLIVIGDASTSLMASKWLRPDSSVFALRHDPDGIDGQYLATLFEGIGVNIETDPERLRDKCLESAAAADRHEGAA